MSTQPLKTVFLDYDTVSNGDLDLQPLREATDNLTLYESSETLIAERIRDADVALLNKLDLTRALLSGASRLKLVALAATGTNNVDLSAARDLGIAVCNVRAYCTASVVQHVWGLILSLTQHVYEFSRLSMDGSWPKDEAGVALSHPIRELQGRIFGVVGWGELGRGGAGIDVLPQEPPARGEPLLDSQIPNLLVTPHIAWAAREARQRCIDEMAANIRDFRSGGRRGRVV
jgi:glycerate dehydrogenase